MGLYRVDARPRFPRGLMFHRFTQDGPEPGPQGALTPSQFDRVLRFVGVDRILPPDEWLDRLERGQLEDDDLCLTFDDGLCSQRDYALPVLELHGLRAFWFVCSAPCHGRPIWSEVFSHASVAIGGMGILAAAFLERCTADVLARLRTPEFKSYAAALSAVAPFYSRQDLEYRFIRNHVDESHFGRLMGAILRERGVDVDGIAAELFLKDADLARLSASGHVVGLHSWDHPYEMARLPPSVQRNQYERNHAHIAAVTGTPPIAMAHPLNSYGADTLTSLRGLGVRCGFRDNVAQPPSGRINGDPLELARQDAADLLAALGDDA